MRQFGQYESHGIRRDFHIAFLYTESMMLFLCHLGNHFIIEHIQQLFIFQYILCMARKQGADENVYFKANIVEE